MDIQRSNFDKQSVDVNKQSIAQDQPLCHHVITNLIATFTVSYHKLLTGSCTPPAMHATHSPPPTTLRHTVNERAVRIILECILL